VTALRPITAVVQRVLPAAPDVVFDEWLDPDALADWMCPRPARVTSIELDPRVGGRLRIDISENGVPFHVVGTYLDLDRPRRLQFTWSCSTWVDPNLETVVTVTLEPHDGSDTLMTIHHAVLPTDQVSSHESGWKAVAAQLEIALRRRTDPGGSRCRSGGDNVAI
jgi:uncharacterized protein YndB with AHSA1/START domain